MKRAIIHAPSPRTSGDPPFGPGAFCGAQMVTCAEPHGHKVTCRTCLKALHAAAQFCNVLHAHGIDVSGLPPLLRNRRRRPGYPKENA